MFLVAGRAADEEQTIARDSPRTEGIRAEVKPSPALSTVTELPILQL